MLSYFDAIKSWLWPEKPVHYGLVYGDLDPTAKTWMMHPTNAIITDYDGENQTIFVTLRTIHTSKSRDETIELLERLSKELSAHDCQQVCERAIELATSATDSASVGILTLVKF